MPGPSKPHPSVRVRRQPLSESESRAAATATATASRALPMVALGRAASPCPSLADGEPATVTWPSVRSPSPSPGHLSPSSPGRPYHANSDGVRWPSHSPQQKHHTMRHRLLGRSGTQGQYQAGTSPSVGRSAGHRRAGAPRRQPITVHSHGNLLPSFPSPPGAVWCSSCVDRHRHVLVEIDSGATATPHPHAWVQQVDVDPRAYGRTDGRTGRGLGVVGHSLAGPLLARRSWRCACPPHSPDRG